MVEVAGVAPASKSRRPGLLQA